MLAMARLGFPFKLSRVFISVQRRRSLQRPDFSLLGASGERSRDITRARAVPQLFINKSCTAAGHTLFTAEAIKRPCAPFADTDWPSVELH
jgi:hypothetical protein